MTALREFTEQGRVTVQRSGCWIWGRSQQSSGYGNAWDHEERRLKLAHRMAWEIANGRPVPPGALVLHSCDTKLCVNPRHLSLGNHSQNAQEAFERGLVPRRVRTHCPSGHPYEEGNIYHRGNGERMCRSCVRRRNKK